MIIPRAAAPTFHHGVSSTNCAATWTVSHQSIDLAARPFRPEIIYARIVWTLLKSRIKNSVGCGVPSSSMTKLKRPAVPPESNSDRTPSKTELRKTLSLPHCRKLCLLNALTNSGVVAHVALGIAQTLLTRMGNRPSNCPGGAESLPIL